MKPWIIAHRGASYVAPENSIAAFRAEYLHCEYESCLGDPQLIEKMHRMGIGVNPWTVDNEEQLRSLLPMNPDGIITNRPELLRKILSEAK